MFIENQISILEWFLKDHVILKTGCKQTKKKNQLCHHRNKIYFQNIAIKINLVYIIIIFLQYYCFYSIRNFSYWERLKVLNVIYFSPHLPWHSNSPAHHNSIWYPHIHLKRCPALHTRCAHTAPPHSAESRRKTSSSDSAPAKTAEETPSEPVPDIGASARETADPEHCSNIH